MMCATATTPSTPWYRLSLDNYEGLIHLSLLENWWVELFGRGAASSQQCLLVIRIVRALFIDTHGLACMLFVSRWLMALATDLGGGFHGVRDEVPELSGYGAAGGLACRVHRSGRRSVRFTVLKTSAFGGGRATVFSTISFC